MKLMAMVPSIAGMLYGPAALPQGKAQGAYAEINGVRYYYEIHGRGEPLLLLHGGLGSSGLLEAGLPALAKSRRVIAVDLHGHDPTAPGDRPISVADPG